MPLYTEHKFITFLYESYIWSALPQVTLQFAVSYVERTVFKTFSFDSIFIVCPPQDPVQCCLPSATFHQKPAFFCLVAKTVRLHLFRDNECHIQCSRYQRFIILYPKMCNLQQYELQAYSSEYLGEVFDA